MHTVHFALCTTHFALCTTHFAIGTVHTLQYVLYTVRLALCVVHCKLYTVHCTDPSVRRNTTNIMQLQTSLPYSERHIEQYESSPQFSVFHLIWFYSLIPTQVVFSLQNSGRNTYELLFSVPAKCPAHPAWFNHPNNIPWAVKRLKLLIIQLSPLSCPPLHHVVEISANDNVGCVAVYTGG